MKASELRIGNLLKRLDESVFSVSANDIKIIAEWDSNKELLPKPIPLTEEWLLEFGFMYVSNKNGHLYYSVFENGWTVLCSYGKWHWSPSPSIINGAEIKYVHQLQNLYFALTGGELTLKSE